MSLRIVQEAICVLALRIASEEKLTDRALNRLNRFSCFEIFGTLNRFSLASALPAKRALFETIGLFKRFLRGLWPDGLQRITDLTLAILRIDSRPLHQEDECTTALPDLPSPCCLHALWRQANRPPWGNSPPPAKLRRPAPVRTSLLRSLTLPESTKASTLVTIFISLPAAIGSRIIQFPTNIPTGSVLRRSMSTTLRSSEAF